MGTRGTDRDGDKGGGAIGMGTRGADRDGDKGRSLRSSTCEKTFMRHRIQVYNTEYKYMTKYTSI